MWWITSALQQKFKVATLSKNRSRNIFYYTLLYIYWSILDTCKVQTAWRIIRIGACLHLGRALGQQSVVGRDFAWQYYSWVCSGPHSEGRRTGGPVRTAAVQIRITGPGPRGPVRWARWARSAEPDPLDPVHWARAVGPGPLPAPRDPRPPFYSRPSARPCRDAGGENAGIGRCWHAAAQRCTAWRFGRRARWRGRHLCRRRW